MTLPSDIDPANGLRPLLGAKRSVQDESSFHRTISLERRRTERSRRPFLLMLLDLTRILADGRHQEVLENILSAVTISIRETDVIGWHQHRAILGLTFTEIPADSGPYIVGTMVSRVSGILYSCLTFSQFSQITISSCVFPEDWDHDVPQRPSNPTLYPDLQKRETGGKLYSATKRSIDIVGSALAFLFLAPVFLAIALAIKLTSKGPVLFCQKRIGQFGTPFTFLKFRSMYLDNDCRVHREYVEQLISGKADRQPSNGGSRGVYKLTKDPRITGVGTLLRRASLDELPQFYNVLRGDMSLVGPRPAIPYEVEAYEIWHRRRILEAKPGITGLWQVSGRSRVAFDEMVRLDVRYATQRSFWLDIKILCRTPWAVIMGEGAH